jgi:hypothetical protein
MNGTNNDDDEVDTNNIDVEPLAMLQESAASSLIEKDTFLYSTATGTSTTPIDDTHHPTSNNNSNMNDEIPIVDETKRATEREGITSSTRVMMPTRCMKRYPRLIAFFCGVLIPLWTLLLITCLFGYIVATSESPYEINSNDAVYAAQTIAIRSSFLITNFTAALPRLCLDIYVDQDDDDDLLNVSQPIIQDTLAGTGYTTYTTAALDISRNSTIRTFFNQTFNSSQDLYDFLLRCGEQARTINTRLIVSLLQNMTSVSQQPTFNWIRCVNESTGLQGTDAFLRAPVDQYRFDAQEQLYQETWLNNQNELFRQNLANDQMSIIEAYVQSLKDATGGSKCGLNGPAATWFFFTVMTSIGYGNMVPETLTGRAIIYTFGFISIVAFGGILANAGYVILTIVDDALSRCRALALLRRPLVAAIMWALMYYTWMLVIAATVTRWKRNRVGLSNTEFDFADGYWFAYISTSTSATR